MDLREQRSQRSSALALPGPWCSTDVVIVLPTYEVDCDLSHGPQYVPQMLGTLLSADADVVIGSRYVAGASAGTDRIKRAARDHG